MSDEKTIGGNRISDPLREILIREVVNGWLVTRPPRGDLWPRVDETQVFTDAESLCHFIRLWADSAKFPHCVPDSGHPFFFKDGVPVATMTSKDDPKKPLF